MKIKKIGAKIIRNSRREKTIEISVNGKRASAPAGKSTGKYEAKSYIKNINHDIKVIQSLKLDIEIHDFSDLKKVEKQLKDKVGANTMFALESAVLKALAKEKGKQVWQLLGNNKAFPMPVGNAIGGGLHSKPPRPDFQEFLFIPQCKSIKEAANINKTARDECKKLLKKIDTRFKGKTNDENAWQTTLDNETVLIIMNNIRDFLQANFKCKINIGIDVASSGFFKSGKYIYKNKPNKRSKQAQINYINDIISEYNVYYIEDPLDENDFQGFSKLKKINNIIVGDDLTATNLQRLKKAKKMKSINAIIVKPNQIGSLIEVSEIMKFCKKNNIKTIVSHRSGETSEDIIADIAFGFGADYIKTGIIGRGREEKLRRLREIERKI